MHHKQFKKPKKPKKTNLFWMISSLATDANRDAIFPELLGGK